MNAEEKVGVARSILDAYGIAVRAGVLTPCLEDEVAMRKMLRLPELPENVRAEWGRTDGVRMPITLQKAQSEQTPATEGNQTEEATND